MQFLHLNETWAWCAEHGVAVDDERHRPADDPTLLHRYRAQYADDLELDAPSACPLPLHLHLTLP